MLPENIMVANPNSRGFATIFQVLGLVPNDAPGVEAVVSADDGITGQVNVGTYPAMRSDRHMLVDHGVRPHADRCVHFRTAVDDGSRVDHAPVAAGRLRATDRPTNIVKNGIWVVSPGFREIFKQARMIFDGGSARCTALSSAPPRE
jgi:hypothetical protein